MRAFIAIAIAVLMPSPVTSALGLAPTRAELDLAGAYEASVDLRIDGRADAETLVDLALLARDADALSPTDGEGFAIDVQPPQLVIPPGGTGRARITARRKGPLAASRSFHLVVEHLAVAVTDEAAAARQQVDFLTRIHLPIHVAGTGQPALDWAIVNDGETRVLKLSNHGLRYQRLGALRAQVASGDDAFETPWLEGPALAQRIGSDALLPGQRLYLSLEDHEIPMGRLAFLPVDERRP